MKCRVFRFHVTPRNGENSDSYCLPFFFFITPVMRKADSVEANPKAKGKGKKREKENKPVDEAAPAKRARGKKAAS